MSAADGPLSGKRCVLTGATGGIGGALARRLGEAGADLALVGRRREVLEELARAIDGLPYPGDLEDPAFIERLVRDLGEVWGRGPDVLVNNAGAFDLSPFAETSPSSFERHISVNLRAPFQLVSAWLPEMLERGSGQIVHVGSVAGRRAFPGNAAYSSTKFGLRGLHAVLVEELRGTGVRTTWIEPSAVDTGLWDRFDPDRRADLPSRAEMLRPEAVAEAIFFVLTQPEDTSIQAVVIRANIVEGRR